MKKKSKSVDNFLSYELRSDEKRVEIQHFEGQIRRCSKYFFDDFFSWAYVFWYALSFKIKKNQNFEKNVFSKILKNFEILKIWT